MIVGDTDEAVVTKLGIGIGNAFPLIQKKLVGEGLSIVLGKEGSQIVPARKIVVIDKKHSARGELLNEEAGGGSFIDGYPLAPGQTAVGGITFAVSSIH